MSYTKLPSSNFTIPGTNQPGWTVIHFENNAVVKTVFDYYFDYTLASKIAAELDKAYRQGYKDGCQTASGTQKVSKADVIVTTTTTGESSCGTYSTGHVGDSMRTTELPYSEYWDMMDRGRMGP